MEEQCRNKIIESAKFFDDLEVNRAAGRKTENLKLLISFSKVKFDHSSVGYYRVARNIFISGLPYMLYFKNLSIGRVSDDFEKAKEIAKKVLIKHIEDRRERIKDLELICDGPTELRCIEIRLELLERALTILRGA